MPVQRNGTKQDKKETKKAELIFSSKILLKARILQLAVKKPSPIWIIKRLFAVLILSTYLC